MVYNILTIDEFNQDFVSKNLGAQLHLHLKISKIWSLPWSHTDKHNFGMPDS